jgi:alpha,alpha-trehalose phosphorylase
LAFGDDGWSVTIPGTDPAWEDWAATLLALSNGSIGVRGTIDELAVGAATTFLAHGYEQTPIAYHERFQGFADSTDTRVPVAEPLAITVTIDGAAVDFATATMETCERRLDLASGILSRKTRWRLTDGRALTIDAERLVPLTTDAVIARRLSAQVDGGGRLSIRPLLAPAPGAAGQSDDPRIGVALDGGGFVEEAMLGDCRVERLRRSGIAVASVQTAQANMACGTDVITAYAVGNGSAADLAAEAERTLAHHSARGFDELAAEQRATLDIFWERAHLDIDGDARAAAALRLNLLHLFRSAGRDGRSSAAAKGLTGEGYEGHYFWDTEAFMLPVLAVLAPDIARAMLEYRYHTLDAARENARALNHDGCALYAWRTIAGRECSAHYPSGSAEYHVNAAIAYGIGTYLNATGDTDFLTRMGAEMLVETARLWLVLGHYRAETDEFCIHGVTGPDEYTALIDNNWYTNRMAQKHLRLACAAVEQARTLDPDGWAQTARRIGWRDEELDGFAEAAAAMRLPYDTQRDLDAQDDSFLGKPVWDLAATPAGKFPLLLHYHPMTLYRHQVAKQADLVLGLVLGGEHVPLVRKRRDFDYYDSVTAHDSTLSACSFSILASEVGRHEQALAHFLSTTLVDVEDRHANASHGVHMASLAGSWLALVWGFAGLRIVDEAGESGIADAVPSFAPQLPEGWRGYRFGMAWRGAELRVDVTADGATYRNLGAAAIAMRHGGEAVTVPPGGQWTGALVPA